MSVDYFVTDDDLTERIAELDVHDSERDDPYVECGHCGRTRERADMGAGSTDDGFVCHYCLLTEQGERLFSTRRHW